MLKISSLLLVCQFTFDVNSNPLSIVESKNVGSIVPGPGSGCHVAADTVSVWMSELLSLLLLLRAVVGGALLLGAGYHDTAAVLARLGQLEAEHPALATTYSIGRSVQGADLRVIRISRGVNQVNMK